MLAATATATPEVQKEITSQPSDSNSTTASSRETQTDPNFTTTCIPAKTQMIATSKQFESSMPSAASQPSCTCRHRRKRLSWQCCFALTITLLAPITVEWTKPNDFSSKNHSAKESLDVVVGTNAFDSASTNQTSR